MQTNFSQIQFDKARHSYTYHGRKLTSVTRVINQLKPPFDADYWSQKKADERGVSKEVILAEWDQKRDASISKGIRVHEHIESVLTGQATTEDAFLALNDKLPEMDAFDVLWQTLAGQVEVEQIEWVIGDGNLGIGGTVDTMLFGRNTNLHHVWDWKTNKSFKTENRFQTLLAPFDDLDDCEFNVYSLQASLYRLIIDNNTNLNLGDSYIVHLSQQGAYRLHKALDLRDRLSAWLS